MGGSPLRFWLQLLCSAGCLALVAGFRAPSASTLGHEPLHIALLRLGTTAAAAALIAQLLLSKKRGVKTIELPADTTVILREDYGVSTQAPVHVGRAKTHTPPIVEGTSRTMRNTDNPRSLSFLPALASEDVSAAAPPAVNAPAPDKALPQYTLAEVGKHCTRDDAWLIIDERVYDVTRFIDKHPGGVGPVVNMAGKDCTDVFANYHAARIYKQMLPAYLIGEMAPGEIVVWPHVADFRRIRQELLRRGLFETDMRYYAKMFAWHALLLFSGLYLSLGFTSCTAHMVGASIIGIFWQQLAGIGHDLGHSGVTHNFWTDHLVGSVLSSLMGLSVGWWKSDHNTHHVRICKSHSPTLSHFPQRRARCVEGTHLDPHPPPVPQVVCNAIEHDPNVQHMPMLAITSKIFRRARFWDSYHHKWVGMDDVAHFLVSYQHLFFYPLMALGRWNLYVQVGPYPIHSTSRVSA